MSSPPPVGPATRLRRAESVRCATVDDQAVLLDLRSGVYYTLNATGAWLWERLSDEPPLAALRDDMVARYDVDATTAWADLAALVDELATDGLVERIDSD